MIIRSLQLSDFRNYETLSVSFDAGTNVLYGDNAQGKTNILEAIFLSCTTKSHKGSKDAELIRFGKKEAHLRMEAEHNGLVMRSDMHLRTGLKKGVAIDGVRMKRASDYINKLRANVILFSPEDLSIIKEGPSERRRFLDMTLCQLDRGYLDALAQYQKSMKQRAQVLKQAKDGTDPGPLLDIFDEQLIESGQTIITARERFLQELSPQMRTVHAKLSGGIEAIGLKYEPHTEAAFLAERFKENRRKDLFTGQTNTGPHRDDISFPLTRVGQKEEIDIRRYGSQGQQRTAALSLKLSEIATIRQITGEEPVLLLDDVLSELDSNRQGHLLQTIGGTQTIITCTGLDDFVHHSFEINKRLRVKAGTVEEAGNT